MDYDAKIDLTTRQTEALKLSWRDPEVLMGFGMLGATVAVVAGIAIAVAQT